MEPATLAGRLDELQVLDVRRPDEWEAGRIEGARHIPLDDLDGRLGEIDRGRPVVTVCRSGDRSGRAAEQLRDEGFDAENLEGGMQAWAGAGLPYRAADGGPGRITDPEPASEPAGDGLSPELQQLQTGFLELIFAVKEHFGDHEPSEEEVRDYLRDRLISQGKTPEEADEFLARIEEGSASTGHAS